MDDKHLYILWTNADPITSEHMVMMYSSNAILNNWWDKVTVIIWGNSQLTVLNNEAVALKLKFAQQAGVEFSACLSCALSLGTLTGLKEKGIEVIKWGEKISKLLQDGAHVLSI